MEGLWIILEQGESAESLAFAQGHFLETVWQHQENSDLRDLRKSPHVLFPGDRLFVPRPVAKSETGSTNKRHRFVFRGVPSRLTFQLRSMLGEILAQIPYELELSEGTLTGVTDDQGNITAPVLPDAATGTVRFKWQGQDHAIRLGMRELDPVETMQGVQKRLQNMGLYSGEIDGLYQQDTIWAIQRFQMLQGIPTNGSIDETTLAKLLEVHGC